MQILVSRHFYQAGLTRFGLALASRDGEPSRVKIPEHLLYLSDGLGAMESWKFQKMLQNFTYVSESSGWDTGDIFDGDEFHAPHWQARLILFTTRH